MKLFSITPIFIPITFQENGVDIAHYNIPNIFPLSQLEVKLGKFNFLEKYFVKIANEFDRTYLEEISHFVLDITTYRANSARLPFTLTAIDINGKNKVIKFLLSPSHNVVDVKIYYQTFIPPFQKEVSRFFNVVMLKHIVEAYSKNIK